MPLPIQVVPSSCGGPVLPLELTRPQWRQDRLVGLEPPRSPAAGTDPAPRRANMSQTRGDGVRQGGAEHGRALHARRRHQPHQFHQMPIDTLRISTSCRCKVWRLVRVTLD
ncbi:uncharacterized protein [Triticum aestivum]|uniref:uncharacterized protein isoform X1 n=1 Tax=Triticum aestivum TaxID=4565 RepID=UPI001D0262EB|nr:uncharacterized protein LOC123152713 isoform X1 [Triticum aestivum]